MHRNPDNCSLRSGRDGVDADADISYLAGADSINFSACFMFSTASVSSAS
jgi:hypothetical protein